MEETMTGSGPKNVSVKFFTDRGAAYSAFSDLINRQSVFTALQMGEESFGLRYERMKALDYTSSAIT